MTSLRSIADAVLSALLAPPCASCGQVLENPLNGAVCVACWDAINPQPASFSLQSIRSASAVGEYEGTLRDILHALKYDGRLSIAPRLSRLMGEQGRSILQGADRVVPVPLHRRRERERGFNQAEELGRGLGIPLSRLLRRIRHTRPQVELPAAERLHNVNRAFEMTGHVDVSREIIVLVDDVTTTGATLDACARVLRHAGAREVRALTAARVATARR